MSYLRCHILLIADETRLDQGLQVLIDFLRVYPAVAELTSV
jgi:hypothetical protein